MSTWPTDEERALCDPWVVFTDTDGHRSIGMKATDDLVAELAPMIARREREAAAQALRDAARLIEHCHRAGLTDRGTVLADLDEFAERTERGDVL